MKPFDLEKALAGEPVKLRNGDKAFVFKVLQNKNLQTPLIGYHINSSGAEFGITWQINGDYSVCANENDIIGMWEEPRPRVTFTLPCPLKEPQEDMWFIHNGEVFKSDFTLSDFTKDPQRIEVGIYFATTADAQEWIDAMRNARR